METGGAVRAVAITMARDEGPMLRRWVDHYGGQFGFDNLLVLDDRSSDGSTEGLPCTVHHLPPLPGGKRFGIARTRLVSGLAAAFLELYDVAVFTDVDEFLVADPARFAGLTDYLAARTDREVYAPVALNVVHVAAVEGPLDPDLPVLGQRRFAKYIPRMCKPSMKRIRAPWRVEGHGIRAPFTVDPELFMFHLKFADRAGLRRIADARHEGFAADGRGGTSSWAVTGAQLDADLDAFVGDVDPALVPELDVSEFNVERVARQSGDSWVTAPIPQLQSMQRQPLRRIPERFVGLV